MESFIVPTTNVYCSNSKTGFQLFPDACLPHPLHLYSSYRGVVATGTLFRQGTSEALGSIATSHLKALPQSSRLGLLIFVSAFLSGSDMGRKERFSAGDKELCFHVHHVCTAEVNTDPWWFCWRRELCQGCNSLSVWGSQSSMFSNRRSLHCLPLPLPLHMQQQTPPLHKAES